MSHVSLEEASDEDKFTTLRVSKKWLEIAVYLLILGADAFYTMEALNLPGASASGTMGAGSFPLVVGLFIGIILVALLLISLIRTRSADANLDVNVHRPLQVLSVIAVLVAQVVTIEIAGPIISIALLAFLIMWLGGERRYLLLLTIPPLLSLGIYSIFVFLLGVYFG